MLVYCWLKGVVCTSGLLGNIAPGFHLRLVEHADMAECCCWYIVQVEQEGVRLQSKAGFSVFLVHSSGLDETGNTHMDGVTQEAEAESSQVLHSICVASHCLEYAFDVVTVEEG